MTDTKRRAVIGATENRYTVKSKIAAAMTDSELGAAYRKHGQHWAWELPCVILEPSGSYRKGYNGGNFAKIYTVRGARNVLKKAEYQAQASLAQAKRALARLVDDPTQAGAVQAADRYRDHIRALESRQQAAIIVYPSIDKVFAP